MKLPQCEREAAVLAAASRGEWTDELRAHARDCAVCSDAALVAEFVAAEPAASITVPDGALIWWKAQLDRKSVV